MKLAFSVRWRANAKKKNKVFQFGDKRVEIILNIFIAKSEYIQIFIKVKQEMVSVSFADEHSVEKSTNPQRPHSQEILSSPRPRPLFT